MLPNELQEPSYVKFADYVNVKSIIKYNDAFNTFEYYANPSSRQKPKLMSSEIELLKNDNVKNRADDSGSSRNKMRNRDKIQYLI